MPLDAAAMAKLEGLRAGAVEHIQLWEVALFLCLTAITYYRKELSSNRVSYDGSSAVQYAVCCSELTCATGLHSSRFTCGGPRPRAPRRRPCTPWRLWRRRCPCCPGYRPSICTWCWGWGRCARRCTCS
jgi:hypothetical protein